MSAFSVFNELLEVRGLSRSFGGIRAVESLSFDAKQGNITGIIGPNGAGKTTVFNLITGVYLPDKNLAAAAAEAGTVRLNGENLVGKPPHEIVRAGVSRTFQNIRLFNRMTCIENVMTPLLVRGASNPLAAFFRTKFVRDEEAQARNTAMLILGEMGLAEAAGRTASTLPYGLQRKLEIARALACAPPVESASSKPSPRLLLLDEPAAGMNEAETNELRDTILKVRKNFGVTILLIEHHMSLVMDVCDHIVVMDRGALLAEGTPQAVRNDERVVTAYLGRPRTRRKQE